MAVIQSLQFMCALKSYPAKINKLWFLVFLFLLISQTLFALDVAPRQKTFTYKIKVRQQNNKPIVGYLKNFTDSAIVYTFSKEAFGAPPAASDSMIRYSNITKVNLRRKGAVGRGTLIGAASGFGTGALLGLAEGDDPSASFFSFTAEAKAFMYGFTLAIIGAAAGATVGALAWKTFAINGNQENFAKMRHKITAKASPQASLPSAPVK